MFSRRKGALASALWMLAAFSPALILAWHISQNAVNTPVWDDWERGPLIEKFREGTLTFRDLYAPHIDHRIFFPRLIILACNELSGGDLRWEIWCTFAMGVAAAAGVWRLARATVFGGASLWGVVFVANLIIFSPIQWDNWLWGIQIAFMTPMACTIWALVVCVQKWRWWVRLAAAVAIAVIGTHSFGHGFAVWPAVFGVALLMRGFAPSRRERVLFLTCWSAIGAIVIGCYALVDFRNTSDETHSYLQAPGEPPPSVVNRHQVLEHPGKAAHFVAVLAGSAFSRLHLADPLELAPIVGWCLIAAFCAFAVAGLIARWRRPEWWDRAIPWLALGGAALVGMAAIAVGRLNLMGYSRAASIRYVSISEYLAIAVLMLSVLTWRACQARSGALLKPHWGAALLGVIAGFMIPAWNHGVQMMRLCREARLQGHAALMFIHHWEPDVMWRIDASAEFVRKQSIVLDRYGLLSPPLVKSLDLAQFDPMERARSASQATVTRFEKSADGTLLAAGHARIETRPADLVLFTWETDGSAPMIFAAAEPTTRMVPQPYPNDLELVGRLKPGKYDFCAWETKLPLERTGLGTRTDLAEIKVRAWVFDVTRRRAYRIQGEWRVSRTGEVVRVNET